MTIFQTVKGCGALKPGDGRMPGEIQEKADANGDVRGPCKKGSRFRTPKIWLRTFGAKRSSTKPIQRSARLEFNEGESNPNNKIYEDKPYPPSNCSYHSSIDVDKPSADFADHCPIDWHLDETSGHSSSTPGVKKYDSGAKTVSVAAAYSLVILAFLFA